MTAGERRALVLFIWAREWVLMTIGALMVGMSLTLAPSARVLERGVGVALALLLLLAMGLYLWAKARRDLLAGRVAEREADIVAKTVERRQATTLYYLSDVAANRYEVSSQTYERAQEGETYRMVHTLGTHIVLSLTRVRKL